jgi:predicted metalloendopeptidase
VHLEGLGVDPVRLGSMNVKTPSAMAPLVKVVKSTPFGIWKNYLRLHLVMNHAHLLGKTIDDANFAFHGTVLGGQPEQRERWKRAVMLIGAQDSLGQAIGQLYVERHYSAEAASKMDALVNNLRAAFQRRLERLAWMSPETKEKAMEKLASFNPKIGHPKKWRDFSSVTIVPDDLLANVRAVRKYWHDDMLARLDVPTDKDEWFMTPQTINAYYNPQFNEVVFPAAILQPPFFDPHADPAVNYAAIGAVIGHEMGHGFDDQGSRYDAQGVQKNWWTDEDRKKFEQFTARLVEQYGGYEVLPGQNLNGQLTLGENIGDLGGLAIAYDAYRMSLGDEKAPVIDGLTGDQRFFLSWAQLWKSITRDELSARLLKVDPHSPSEFRVNGVVRNLDAWYEAFAISKESALYLEPDERVGIW